MRRQTPIHTILGILLAALCSGCGKGSQSDQGAPPVASKDSDDSRPNPDNGRDSEPVYGSYYPNGWQVDSEAAKRGFHHLTSKTYAEQTPRAAFDNLWLTWDPASRQEAMQADEPTRQKLLASRYGFHQASYDNEGLPVQFTRNGSQFALNCFTCHTGSLAGKVVYGLPNNQLDLQSFVEDLVKLGYMNAGQPIPEDLPIPRQNYTKGTSNAFKFTTEFLSRRDMNMNVLPEGQPVDMGNVADTDLDAPAFWELKYKKRLYRDRATDISARALMQFAMNPIFDAETFTSFEDDYKDILAYILSIEPPPFPKPIQQSKAARGRDLFNKTCAGCHGRYHGKRIEFPDLSVPITVVGTEGLRLEATTVEFWSYYQKGWLAEYGKSQVQVERDGYLAPPLVGIWASAPYFHNGSVPTIYHVLNSRERPTRWKVPNYDRYDMERVGLAFQTVETIATNLTSFERRKIFDATLPSKSNIGHPFGDHLSDEQRFDIIEYLKGL